MSTSIKDFGVWKDPDMIYVKDAGVWKEIAGSSQDEYGIGEAWLESTPLDNSVCLAFANNMLVVGGSDGGRAAIVTSINGGLTWGPVRILGLTSSTEIRSIAFGNGYWMAAANNGIFRSTDTASWSSVFSGNNITSVAHANSGRWAAVQLARVYTSANNGGTWIDRGLILGTGVNFHAIAGRAGLNNAFLVVGDDGKAATGSLDGETWTPVDVGFGTSAIYNISTAGSAFIVCGDGGKMAQVNTLLVVREIDTGITQAIRSVAVRNSPFLAFAFGGSDLRFFDESRFLSPWNTVTGGNIPANGYIKSHTIFAEDRIFIISNGKLFVNVRSLGWN